MKWYVFIGICFLCSTFCGKSLNINNKDVRENFAMVADDQRIFAKENPKPDVNWSFYPNPVENILYITGLEGHYTIKMVDAVGRVVLSVKGTSTEQELDMSSKPAGMYLLKIESQGKSVIRKLIKK